MKKELLIVVFALLLSACATGSNREPSYSYSEFQVINNSNKSIRNLTVRSAESGDVFSCENIAPLGICQERFALRRYKKGAFSVDWVFGDSARQTNEVGIEVPAYNSPGVPLSAVLEISPEGTMSAYFKQESRRI
jgi:hypothetical protein